MTEAMKVRDVRDYVADLRKQLPPEKVAKMLNAAPAGMDKPKAVPMDDLMGPRTPPPGSVSVGIAMVLLALWLLAAGALVFVAFAWPWFE
jgi:hypothetical protein